MGAASQHGQPVGGWSYAANAVLAHEHQPRNKESHMGDIGTPVRHIELQPVEAPQYAPVEPVVAPERESVPA